ncbi:iron-containing alcohol dehydrogenase [Geomonas sp. RF6]|uniref:iron-containing alcohol dehydrogenase n=1 Tax=Geomonas sp. RF6 TaxID=2897342 RepID=UPI001E6327C4|nr:iron-containing alcohol dehydrogenase [Geomonas sp. RF6]UFS70779.1 iron-containing alcohol dehydrogenase [Geomonas sp. RF6]
MALADEVFDFFIPSITKMGVGAVKQLGSAAKYLGAQKALIVTDQGLVKLGVADQMKKLLEDSGIAAVIYGGAEPNPTDKNVREGVKIYKESKCDALVSLGGGSSHDCAKGIGIVVSNGGDIREYAGIDTVPKALPPFIAINTTAGTASEMTRFAVITNTDTHVKMIFATARITPAIAINDPVLMVGMPPALTAATGMDALTHAIEAYVAALANPVTDACALAAIRLVAEWLSPAVANGDNLMARDKMAYAEYLAGMAFNNAGIGIVHAMAHQPGALLNKPHGVCNAILLPHGCSFNLIACPQRFADIAEAMGVDITGLMPMEAAEKGVEAIRKLSASVGIPAGLSAIGVKESDIPVLAESAFKDICCLFNPRKIRPDDIVELYKQAM